MSLYLHLGLNRGLRDWLVTGDSGWMAYTPGLASRAYGFDLGYFEGPRFFEVYVADQAENVSAESKFAIINYIKPGNFIFSGALTPGAIKQ